jgi:tRNA A37 threonylcarbamoyladenosine synthetase subunit TsaC/SUA5/YrdC
MFDNTVVKSLRSGHVIVLPTDTVYGLACSVFKPSSGESYV